MIGSISKIRPCGNHHIYKYSHAQNINDIKLINNYTQDVTQDGEFYYPLNNFKTAHARCFQAWNELRSFKDNLSKIGNTQHLFTLCSNLEKLDLELNGKSYIAVPGIQLKNDVKRDFKLRFNNSTGINNALQQCRFLENSNIQISAPKATTMNSLFEFYGGGILRTGCNIEIDTRQIISAKNSFHNALREVDELSLPIDEDGNHTFVSGKPMVDRIYNSFPNLSNGEGIFKGCWLSKNYAKHFLNTLPDWSEDTAEHLLTIGINFDYQFDTEVLNTIKNTIDKGWNINVEWNGNNHTINEVLSPYMESILNNDDILLPEGYIKLNYLENNKNSYINTDYKPTNSTGVYCIAKLTSIPSSNSCPIGVVDGDFYYISPLLGSSLMKIQYGWGTWNVTSLYGNMSYFESKLNFLGDMKATLKTNSEDEQIYDLNQIDFNCNFPIFIFGNNNKGNCYDQWRGRIYRVKISEGTEIVRDFVPCLNPDGEPCMFEYIEGKEYKNNSTNDIFIFG